MEVLQHKTNMEIEIGSIYDVFCQNETILGNRLKNELSTQYKNIFPLFPL